jgi:7-keto-8-aminopelargonate synthetase-like enzyme
MKALDSGAPLAQHVPAALGARDALFDAVEKAGAAALGTEASVYFSSGYLIGMVGLASLASSFSWLLIDECAHYNLHDAAKASRLPSFSFATGDADSLRTQLRRHGTRRGRPLVLTDGVFPTTGRVPPLAEYKSLIRPYGGRIFIDESHAFGVMGAQGRGAAEYCSVEDFAYAGATLSKAFCAQGALFGCSFRASARLRRAGPIRGACAGSPLSAAAASASLAYTSRHPEMRKNLRKTAEYFRSRLRAIGIDVVDTPAAIVSFTVGTHKQMAALQRKLFKSGVYIYHSTYIGAGPEGMIRCAVFRDHTTDDIDMLIDLLR